MIDNSSHSHLTDVNSPISSSIIEPNDFTSSNIEVDNDDYELLQSNSNHNLNVSYFEDTSYLETKST